MCVYVWRVKIRKLTLSINKIRMKIKVIFMPYCNLAISGLPEMNANIFLLHVNGNGRIKTMKIIISNMRSAKTYRIKGDDVLVLLFQLIFFTTSRDHLRSGSRTSSSSRNGG